MKHKKETNHLGCLILIILIMFIEAMCFIETGDYSTGKISFYSEDCMQIHDINMIIPDAEEMDWFLCRYNTSIQVRRLN